MSVEANRDFLTLKVMRLSQPSYETSLWSILSVNDVFSALKSSPSSFLSSSALHMHKNMHLSNLNSGSSAPPASSSSSELPSRIDRYNDDMDEKEEEEEEEEEFRTQGDFFVNQQPIDTMHSLLLPVAQGRIYNGETFNAYINLSNSSNYEVLNVVVLVELLINQNRYILFDNSQEPFKVLDSNGTYDFSVMHQLLEVGIYTLVCVVSYKVAEFGEQPKSFRKAYKFSAHLPFTITHKVMHLNGGCFAECCVENNSCQSILLCDAAILCAEGVEGVRLDTTSQAIPKGFKGIHYFKPCDKYSLLFSLRPCSAQASMDDSFLKRLGCVGRLRLEWRTATGGAGSLENYQVTTEMEHPKLLEIRVTSCPASVQVEYPFEVELEVINRRLEGIQPLLILNMNAMKPIYAQGNATRTIGLVEGSSTRRFSLTLVCLEPGVQKMKGISVHDPESRINTDGGELGDILVF